MGEPRSTREAQIEMVVDRLTTEYPDATISLDYTNRLELLIAVILSAQCTDARVNRVTSELFETYRTPEDFANADQDALADAIGSITYFNSKADYIRRACQRINEEFDGQVPDTMEDLTSLPGVGRKTANVVLQHGHHVVEGVVVDTHVQRLTRRLGITDERTPEAIERDLMTLLSKPDWQRFTHLCISHGRTVCTARSPACAACVLEDICPSSQLDRSVDLASGEEWT